MGSDINYHGQVVVFDLDDTLFRERGFCRSGFRFLCDPEKYTISDITPYPSSEEFKELVFKMECELENRRNPFLPFEEYLTPRCTSQPFDLQPHIEAYRNHLPDKLNFAEGAEATLKSLAERGIRMALITDGRSGTQRRKIEALGITNFISPELILISEETGFDKHSKEMFASIVRHFPEASGFYYVGDNPLKDFYFPNLLGWTSVSVPYHPDNVHPEEIPPTPLHSPRFTLNEFPDLLKILDNKV